jgi:hypothetical protein
MAYGIRNTNGPVKIEARLRTGRDLSIKMKWGTENLADFFLENI